MSDDELREPERRYRQAREEQARWLDERDNKKQARRRFFAEVARESLPNVIRTVAGAGIIYLAAVVSGALEGARALDVIATVTLAVSVLGGLRSFFLLRGAPNPIGLEELEREAMRAELERLRRRAGIAPDDAP